MPDQPSEKKTLEIRVAELEDKLSKVHITEEEMKTYNKVASLMGSQAALPPCSIAAAPPPCVAAQPSASPCIAAQPSASPCIAAQPSVSPCIAAPQPCIAQTCTIFRCIIQRCIISPCIIRICVCECFECGGGCAPGPLGGGGGFGTLGT